MWRHGLEPGIILVAGRYIIQCWRGQTVGGLAGLTVCSQVCVWVSRTGTPLLNAEIMDKGHAACTFAGRNERIFNRGMRSHEFLETRQVNGLLGVRRGQ